MTAPRPTTVGSDINTWRDLVARRHLAGDRLAALFATAHGDTTTLNAAMAGSDQIELLQTTLAAGMDHYPSLTPAVPAAFWYEREIHDLFGVRPDGHPRLDALILPLPSGSERPRPGNPHTPDALTPDEKPVAGHLTGVGLFTLPHGPVRSGVVESVEYLVETPGENIPHLRVRPHAKHRGIEKRFEGLDPATGVLLAERVEGIASVAHAAAYASAVERLAGVEIPPTAAFVRLVHAELERIANHLDVVMRLCDASALGVATARFGWHKERVMRLRSELCGSRFGRNTICLGGIRSAPAQPTEQVRIAVSEIEKSITGDQRAAMTTASFLDRLRGTGPLSRELARQHGALGPIGRASGVTEDVRISRPYGAYTELAPEAVVEDGRGDVQARLSVRWGEIHESFRLIRAALRGLDELGETPREGDLRADVRAVDGVAMGWAEAPQGEVLYTIEVVDGQLSRVKPRSASFHNLLLFHAVFAGDIFTDFPFIEASFGLSIAGVAS